MDRTTTPTPDRLSRRLEATEEALDGLRQDCVGIALLLTVQGARDVAGVLQQAVAAARVQRP